MSVKKIFQLVLLIAGAVAILSACASVQELEQKMIKGTRKSGEKLALSPDETMKAHSCEPGKENALFLEMSEVLPERVNPGREINHRVQVAFCPSAPTVTAKGYIIRRILYKGQPTFTDHAQYEFKPGTWTVDAFLGIPENAPSGIYALEVFLTCQDKTLKQTNNFFVKER